MKMSNLTRNYTYLLAVLVLAFTACSPGSEERAYGDWDEDANTTLDEREFGNAWGESGYYDRWDTNSDGFLDDTEWTAGRDENLEGYNGVLGDWDTDADNRLNEDEFRRGVYGFYDRDRDNMINEEEYNAWYRADR